MNFCGLKSKKRAFPSRFLKNMIDFRYFLNFETRNKKPPVWGGFFKIFLVIPAGALKGIL